MFQLGGCYDRIGAHTENLFPWNDLGVTIGPAYATGDPAMTIARRPADRPFEPVSDLMPLDYMLRIVRDPDADPKRRDRMAKAAAQYCSRPAGTAASDSGMDRHKANAVDRFLGFAPVGATSKIVTLEPNAAVAERIVATAIASGPAAFSITTDLTPEETARLERLGYLRDGELEDRDRIAHCHPRPAGQHCRRRAVTGVARGPAASRATLRHECTHPRSLAP